MLKLKILTATTLIETSQACIWTDISAGSNRNSSKSTNTCLNTHWCCQHNCMWNFWLNQELFKTALRHSFTWTSRYATTVPLTSPALHGQWTMFHTYIYDKYRTQRPEKMHFTHSIPNPPQSIQILNSGSPDFVVFLYKFSLSNVFTMKSWKSGFWTHIYML